MVLTKKEILERIKKGELSFDPPLDKFQLQPHSVDLRLGFTFLVPKTWQMTGNGRVGLHVDYAESRSHFDVIGLEEGQYFEILPREFVVVSTLEKIKLPSDLMGILYPRSSINRRGLSVDLSGIIDSRYEGNLVIPVRNNTSTQVIRVYPGERFCQVVFYPLASRPKGAKSRYQYKDIVVGVLKERSAKEMRLIKKGNIRELKRLYKLDY